MTTTHFWGRTDYRIPQIAMYVMTAKPRQKTSACGIQLLPKGFLPANWQPALTKARIRLICTPYCIMTIMTESSKVNPAIIYQEEQKRNMSLMTLWVIPSNANTYIRLRINPHKQRITLIRMIMQEDFLPLLIA